MNAERWASVALEAMARGGLAAVAVEPLAARLGVTKGSFYWHYPNRNALVRAALDLWEKQRTEDIIADVETQATPLERIRRLFLLVAKASERDLVEMSLFPNAQDPLVRPALKRVTRRRVTYVAELFEAMGFPPEEARRRSLFAHSSRLGLAQLTRMFPEEFSLRPKARRDYLEDLVGILTGPPSR